MADMPQSPDTLAPNGRVIMISGATGGIGAAFATRLHGDGFRVSLGARDVDRARHQFADFDPERVFVHRFEATDAETAGAWVDATAERFGRIDGLINNAGVLRQISMTEGDETVLDDLWAINVKAPYRLTRLALPHLKAGGNGRVINVASTDGKRYRDGVSVGYAMTKHAVLALTHATKFAAWEEGVRVTALCPGAVDTEMIANIPGVTPKAQRLRPETLGEIVALLLRLPNNALVAEMVVNTRLESGF